ncbi:MFS general substrate transporter [Xylariaceae sp. FL0016]|nr:MFS general substrate transporter [Xylariaceae sp. FL0016]
MMDEDHRFSIDEASPDAPLLGTEEDGSSNTRTTTMMKRSGSWCMAAKPTTISILACIALFLWVLSGTIVMVPVTSIAEDIFCKHYHGDGAKAGGHDCKSEDVQSAMAYVIGFTMAISGLISLIVAFPFGVLADRSRKPVYFLAAVGQFVNLGWALTVLTWPDVIPIQLAVISPLFQLIGGGIMTAISIIFSIIADVQSSENRSIWYFFLSLAAQSAVFVGPSLGSKLMGVWSPWVPMYLSLVTTALAGLVMLPVPETASIEKQHGADHDVLDAIRGHGWLKAAKMRLSHHIKTVRSKSMFRKRPVILVLITFMLHEPLVLGTTSTFLQYYSKRFDRTIEEAGYMLSIRGGVTVVVMGVILPVLSKVLSSSASRIHLPPFRRDLTLARSSAAFSFLGFLALAGPDVGFVIAGLVVLTLSSGLGPLCRSLLTNFAEPGETAQLFAIVSIIETIGQLPAGPFLAWSFSTGMRLRGLWIGLPFFLLAGISLLAMACLCLIDGRSHTFDYRAVPANEPDGDSVSIYTLEGEAEPL